MEDGEGNPCQIKLHIGKSGKSLQAWAESLAELATLGLQNNLSIYQMLSTLCDIKSDKLEHSSGIPIFSGPDGLVQAILFYLKEKEDERYSAGDTAYRKSFVRRREGEIERPDGTEIR